MNFNKYTMFFLMILLSLYTVSCSQASTGTDNGACSKENLNGECETAGMTCVSGACFNNGDLCSSDRPNGVCEQGDICYNGACEDTGELPCSQMSPNGKCEDENAACLNGVCVNDSELCSSDNLTGKCNHGTVCIDGICENNIGNCSLDNPNGSCEDNQTCIDGECQSNSNLCSADNPNGLCQGDKTCNGGICIDKACEENQRRNCYPRDENEVNIGICRRGIQICKDSIWGDCVGAITPKDEICDYQDDNCNGDIDEGVKNICGDCRAESELPAEIPNNSLDDDCDGKIDEDSNGNGGMESCEGRMNQPCYTGPIGTNGKGICVGGTHDCQWDTSLEQWTIWTECLGQVLPKSEYCGEDGKGDSIDNNCNGIIDENCLIRECADAEICGNNIDDDCNNLIDDECVSEFNRDECTDTEICGNGFDDDCNGSIDEGCSCGDLTEMECFSADPSMTSYGDTTLCQKGVMFCIGGEFWGSCSDEVLPESEICDGIDNDCDGIIDNNVVDGNACGTCDGEPIIEICNNNIDDNCDGLIDENCLVGNCTNPSEEVCDGADNDCDGLIDEGVLNSCGKCSGSCYEINIDTDNDENCNENSVDYPDCLNNINDDFDDGVYDGVVTDTDGSLTLNLEATIQNDFIWIANSAGDSLTKINTTTGDIEGPFPVGDNPSRTAVERDGSVWVANRGRAGGTEGHSLTKLNTDGSFAFNVNLDINCAPRGLAVDREGNVWVGCFALRGSMGASDGDVYKISSEGNIFAGFPKATGVPIYGLAIDGRGYLWSSRLSDSYSGTAARSVFKIDTNKSVTDAGFLKVFSFNYNFQSYGLVVDYNNNVWYGGWGDNGIKKLVYSEATDSITVTTHVFSGGGNGRGIAVDSQGHIWCAFSGSDKVGKFSMTGAELGSYSSKGTSPIGIGVDGEDEIWVVNRDSDKAVQLNQSGVEISNYTTGAAPYSYSDLTGFNLKNIVSPSGSFTLIQDTGYTTSIYDSVKIQGETPSNSKIKARVKVSNDLNTWSDWSDSVEYVNDNTDMPLTWAGNKPSGRYIKIEITLHLGDDDAKPKFSGIQISWQRP